MRERKLKRAMLSVGRMSADEKRALLAALECLREMRGPVRKMEECLADIGIAMQRTIRRRESDAVTDKARRKTVGARLPLAEAERCARCAAFLEVSMYRFVVDALENACERVERLMGENPESVGVQCSAR